MVFAKILDLGVSVLRLWLMKLNHRRVLEGRDFGIWTFFFFSLSFYCSNFKG